jgi:hypothetical protein
MFRDVASAARNFARSRDPFPKISFFEIEGFIYGVRAWIARRRRRAERVRRRGLGHAGVCLASDQRWSRSVLVNALTVFSLSHRRGIASAV